MKKGTIFFNKNTLNYFYNTFAPFVKKDDWVILANIKPILDLYSPILQIEWFFNRKVDDYMFDVIDYIGYKSYDKSLREIEDKSKYCGDIILIKN